MFNVVQDGKLVKDVAEEKKNMVEVVITIVNLILLNHMKMKEKDLECWNRLLLDRQGELSLVMML